MTGGRGLVVFADLVMGVSTQQVDGTMSETEIGCSARSAVVTFNSKVFQFHRCKKELQMWVSVV